MSGLTLGGAPSPPKAKRRARPLTLDEQLAAAYAEPRPGGPPSTRDPAWGVPISGGGLVVGDTIVHLGRRYLVDRIGPYRGGLRCELGADARTAYSGRWGISIGASTVVRILPRDGDAGA